MNKIVNISIWLLSLGAIVALLGFVEHKNEEIVCRSMNISIERPNKNFFVMEEDVRQMVLNLGYGEGMRVNQIDVAHLEKLMNNNASIKHAEIYTTIDGVLNIELKQRNPIIRVFAKDGSSYYIDEQGWLMPLSNKYTSRVVVANGEVETTYASGYELNVMDENQKDENIKNLYQIASFIHKKSFWKSQIVQIFVKKNEDLVLIPRVGNHEIIFGGVDKMEEKFEKLIIFYEKGLRKTGWNGYKRINLKYKNQVVCTKK